MLQVTRLPTWYGHLSSTLLGVSAALWIISLHISDTLWRVAFQLLVSATDINAAGLLMYGIYVKNHGEAAVGSSNNSKDDWNQDENGDSSEQPSDTDMSWRKARGIGCMKKKSYFFGTFALVLVVYVDAFFSTRLFFPFTWQRNLMVFSSGVFLAALAIHYIESCSPSPKKLWLALASATTLVCWGITLWLYFARRQAQLEPLQTFFSSNAVLYEGEAHVRGVTLRDNETTHCTDWYDPIPVEVEVLFGGYWACPLASDTYCEVTIESKVECRFWLSQKYLGDDDDRESGYVVANVSDAYEHVQHRYHNYRAHNEDDDEYDPYGFDDDDAYNPKKAPPSYRYWNHPTETIVGNCETCQAKSLPKLQEEFLEAKNTLNIVYALAGVGLSSVVWIGIVLKAYSSETSDDRQTPLVAWPEAEMT